MRYSLWSHGTIIGYTDLDIECISENLRMGFVEPTDAGKQALLDATGVHAVCASRPPRSRDGREDSDPEYLERFEAACARREALDLELRDEAGQLFPCAYMRIYDSFLKWPEETDEYDPLDDPDLDPELRAQMEADRADIEEWFRQSLEDAEADAWKHGYEEPDPRYETVQYTVQVVLREEPFLADEPWQ